MRHRFSNVLHIGKKGRCEIGKIWMKLIYHFSFIFFYNHSMGVG